ncbi:(Fe-S)-binding protein [Sulfobacillus sp. hq2]|uniref:(Fe-S)-binding protein n=1 Tax=Sulfobacillus sp. hq2 TaxID=2039167 RepID=UPI001A9A466E|nr:(Fe-S)-binding protein [Sulfobacillus sp. hq2]MCY0907065.1 (Fe-S)-binding protein [Sulfobacillus thermotolerans]
MQKAKAIELDIAVVDGVELNGSWNRMFEPRVISEYDLSVLDSITQIPGAESLGYCYQCGKCTGVCPVDTVGDYSPRKVFRRTQLGISLIDSPDLWLCTTCRNCLRVCPKEVNMINIMPAVREQAVLEGKAPDELLTAFENTARYGNPIGESPRKRADWTKNAGVAVPIMSQRKAPVDVLWFVECYPSYHPRGKEASSALARVFDALSVDYGILGTEEKCAGDSQRMAGERGLFEMLAEHNIKMLSKYTFNQLVVTDPHAYNAFLHEYPKMGGEWPVQHYTQFLAERLNQVHFVKALNKRVTFHDPCYLGRHNGEYEAPRALLAALPGIDLVEMGHCRETSYCCGGGGGGMWMDSFTRDYASERLSERRVKEAIEYGAEILAVSCPYEVPRFEDAVKSTGHDGELQVMDIAELMAYCMGLNEALVLH